jgi:hypothetical protein
MTEQEVRLPIGACILTVQSQRDRPELWALVNEAEPRNESVLIGIIATGEPIRDNYLEMKYISTFKMYSDEETYHAYILTK